MMICELCCESVSLILYAHKIFIHFPFPFPFPCLILILSLFPFLSPLYVILVDPFLPTNPSSLLFSLSFFFLLIPPSFFTPHFFLQIYLLSLRVSEISPKSKSPPMSSFRSDLMTARIYPEPLCLDYNNSNNNCSNCVDDCCCYDDEQECVIDHFDRLPDSLLLLVFNKIGDVKALGRCCVVSRRFQSLVPQVENVVVRVDCVISDDDSSSSASSADKSRSPFANLVRLIFGNIFKPLQALGQFLGPKRSGPGAGVGAGPALTASSASSSMLVGNGIDDEEGEHGSVTHHSPTQVLKNFREIRFLRIELPSGELGIDDGVLLKWRADFGSTLDNCVILGASSVVYNSKTSQLNENGVGNDQINVNNDDNGSIPESFYTNGGLKLRVVWTISSLIAASARHYLLQPIIAEHQTLDSLVLTDFDGQGVLCMNRGQLEELRVKPLSASSASKRTLVPALNMRLWYAPHLELPDGVVLKGATLVAIRPSEQSGVSAKKEISDLSWISTAFEEPYGTAAKMLVKRRTYCLEMNSF